MKLKVLSAALYIVTLMGAGPAIAQQPGSSAYNTQVLPAHGLGDTRRGIQSWGAYAMASNSFLGLSSNARSEREARTNAIKNCASRGGVECEIVSVYANGCIAIAVNEDAGFYATGSDLEEVKRRALDNCGEGCEIFRDECSLP